MRVGIIIAVLVIMAGTQFSHANEFDRRNKKCWLTVTEETIWSDGPEKLPYKLRYDYQAAVIKNRQMIPLVKVTPLTGSNPRDREFPTLFQEVFFVKTRFNVLKTGINTCDKALIKEMLVFFGTEEDLTEVPLEGCLNLGVTEAFGLGEVEKYSMERNQIHSDREEDDFLSYHISLSCEKIQD